MALQEVFLSPLAFVGLLALVPILLLYLVRPDPRRIELPTVRYLLEGREEDATSPLFERLTRNLLLFLQLLVVIALVVALAGPYVTVSSSQTVAETISVVDASASMTTQQDGDTRFDRAVAMARETISGTNSIVLAGSEPRIVLRRGGGAEVAGTLDSVSVTEAPGDLAGAITQAASIAGENARIVVFSDFAGPTAWIDAVRAARARGLQVSLRQVSGGGTGNVGIIDRSFTGRNVSLSVKNYGDTPATRTLRLGEQSRTLSLDPGMVERVTVTVPAGGGRAELSPGDSFPTDDTAVLAAPADPTVDVLLISNDPDRYLRTALSVIDHVRLTVREPPTTVSGEPDVVVFSDTNPDRLLDGTVAAAREAVERGGGVAVIAQEDPPAAYGSLLLIDTSGTTTNPSIGRVATDDLTRDIDFPPPEGALNGLLRSGTALVETTDGSPLVAIAARNPGRILYYGYLPRGDTFRFYFQYPVFWKRAIYALAGRESLESLNLASGERLQFANATQVRTPTGTVSTTTLQLNRIGTYVVGSRRLGVSLFSESESDVVSGPLAARQGDAGAIAREEQTPVPRPLTWAVALLGLVVALVEVGVLRRMGDL